MHSKCFFTRSRPNFSVFNHAAGNVLYNLDKKTRIYENITVNAAPEVSNITYVIIDLRLSRRLNKIVTLQSQNILFKSNKLVYYPSVKKFSSFIEVTLRPLNYRKFTSMNIINAQI